jgi:hypothetical protein
MSGNEIRESSFGGFGLFATRRFEEDEEIISEPAFLSIVGITNLEGNPHNHWTTTPLEVSDYCDAAISISQAVHELSPDITNLFWEFSQSPIYGGQRTAHGIFYTNYIDVTPHEGPDIGCMFRRICRVNHSCKPNAYWYYKQSEGQLALHASRAVDDGEELLVDYCGHDECDEWCVLQPDATRQKPCVSHDLANRYFRRDSERRRQHLAVFFGFVCACPLCARRPPPPD